jgi:putative lysine transport system ATP-binding protein
MNLLETPDSGHIWFHGEDLAAERVNINRLRQDIGMVFQSFNLFNNMNVLDNCMLAPVTTKRADKAEAERRARENIGRVGLSDFINAPVTSLSGGQKQRVAIAGIIAMMPRCMIFDESTAMLDPVGRREVVETMERLNREQGITVLSITHYMDEAARADRVIVLSDGKVVLDGRPEEVFSHGDILLRVGLELPQCTAVSQYLRARGVPLDGVLNTPEQCANAIARAWKNRRQ